MSTRRKLFAPPKPAQTPQPVVPETPLVTKADNPAPVTTLSKPTFEQWLNSPIGRDCSSPRLPSNSTRLTMELEFRLRKAFEAGGGQ